LIASSANGMVFGHSADTAGLHRLAVFTLVVSGLLLVLTVADRSLRRVGAAEKG
jgi:hypothetical protein